jgi:hypothetical protein
MEKYKIADLEYENLRNRLKDTTLTISGISRSYTSDYFMPAGFILEGNIDGKYVYIKMSNYSDWPLLITGYTVDVAMIDGRNVSDEETKQFMSEFQPYLEQKAKEQYESDRNSRMQNNPEKL